MHINLPTEEAGKPCHYTPPVTSTSSAPAQLQTVSYVVLARPIQSSYVVQAHPIQSSYGRAKR